jgi:hypothetical protein
MSGPSATPLLVELGMIGFAGLVVLVYYSSRDAVRRAARRLKAALSRRPAPAATSRRSASATSRR